MDIFIFVTFLIITLIVGISYGRQVKTIQDYALGGNSFSTNTLAATIVATWIGGSFLSFNLSLIYKEGLAFAISLVCDSLTLLVTGLVLAKRVGRFLKKTSVAEALGELYGSKVRIITALCGVLVTLGGVAVQFKVSAKIFSCLLGIDGPLTTIIAAGIVIFYSAFGGIRSVTFTDVVQFLAFGTLMPILALVIWNNLKNPDTVMHTLQTNPMFSFGDLFSSPQKIASWSTLALFYFIPGLVPPIFQRISMAKNIIQVRKSSIYAFGLCLLIALLTTWIGVLIKADQPDLNPDKIFQYIFDRYTYVGLRGLLLSGVMAMIMSTADSHLNAAAVLFANDLAKPLNFSKTPLNAARVSSCVLGILALFLALYATDFLGLVLLAWGFYMPIVTVPLLLSIFGFQSSSRAVLIGMGTGFIMVLLWRNFLEYTGVDGIIPGMAVNLIALLGSHYLLGEPGGWQKVVPESLLGLERATRRRVWRKYIETIKSFQLYPYLQQNLPKKEGLYALFGFYTIAATYTGFYTIDTAGIQAHREIYEGIYHTVLFATTAFITFPIWPPTVKNRRFITFFWPLGIGAVLFFAGTLLVILSNFHTMQLLVLMNNILIAALLLRWGLAFTLVLGGISLAVLFFKYYTGDALSLIDLGSLQFKILYGLLLFTSLLIALFISKQAYAQLGRKNQALTRLDQENKASLLQITAEKHHTLQALQNAGVNELLTIFRELQTIGVEEKDKERLQEIKNRLIPIVFQLPDIDNRANEQVRLQIATSPIQRLLDRVQEKIQETGIRSRMNYKCNTRFRELVCDFERIATLLTKSLVVLQEHVEAHHEHEEGIPSIFSLIIEDTWLHYPLQDIEEGYIKRVSALRMVVTTADNVLPLAPNYEANLVNEVVTLPKTKQALDQLANSRIIKAHYGHSEVTSNTLLYVIPVDVTEVRPKDIDKPHMELGMALIRANDFFKNDKIDAQAQEKEFLSTVTARSNANINLIKLALELIKWYHGAVNRHSGEPFYLHPLSVAQIVLDYNQEEVTILGALLHDVVEDTPLLLGHIEAVFGEKTATVVDLTTHLQSIPGSLCKIKLSAEENLRALERTGNIQALCVKLADRMHNMRTLRGHASLAKQQCIAKETLQFFVPLAHRLRLSEAANELEAMCHAALQKTKS